MELQIRDFFFAWAHHCQYKGTNRADILFVRSLSEHLLFANVRSERNWIKCQ